MMLGLPKNRYLMLLIIMPRAVGNRSKMKAASVDLLPIKQSAEYAIVIIIKATASTAPANDNLIINENFDKRPLTRTLKFVELRGISIYPLCF
jgi:hypothetical protein